MPAPEDYTIEQVVSREEWDGTDSKMITYELLFQNDTQVLKARTPVAKDPKPEAGQTLKGWKNTDKGTFGFADPNYKPRGGGGRGFGPKDIARMTRSHSQEMALRLIAAGNVEMPDPDSKTDMGAFLNGALRPLIDWFDKDVQAASDAVKEASSAESNGKGEQTSIEPQPPPTEATAADDKIPF